MQRFIYPITDRVKGMNGMGLLRKNLVQYNLAQNNLLRGFGRIFSAKIAYGFLCLVFAMAVFIRFDGNAFAQNASSQNLPKKIFTPSPQDRADLAVIEKYLSSLTSFTARFTQRNPGGGTESGVFYCKRVIGQTGKIRVDYDKPSPITLMTMNGMLLYLDRDRDESSYIPLSSSLVGLFAEPEIRFGGKITVTSLSRRGDVVSVGLIEAENSDFGEVILYFRRIGKNNQSQTGLDKNGEIKLAAWRIIDAGGGRTDMVIKSLENGLPNRPDLFSYVPPQMRRQGSPRGQ